MSTKFTSIDEHEHVYKNGVFVYSKQKQEVTLYYFESNGYGILNSVEWVATDVGDTNGF